MAHKKTKQKDDSEKKRKTHRHSNENDKTTKHFATITGKLDMTRSGMAFVGAEGMARDILIHPEDTNSALNGDEVRVAITKAAKGGNGRAEGKVIEVIKHKQESFSGRLEVKEHFAFLITESKRMSMDIYVPLDMLHGAKNGDHVMVRIVDWSPKKKNPVGEVTSIMTESTMGDIAMQGILVESGFPLTFPDEVLEEAARFSEYIDEDELKKRQDLRGLLTITIDPQDAKDFDDAISLRLLEDGLYEVGVHIADVSYFVKPDSALEGEAYKRATSVYLPDRVLPMLPERLSNELCSLRPDEDKYAFSALFKMDKKGKVKEYWLGKTVIRSQRRLAYEDAQAIIEGGEDPLREEILLLNSIAQSLRAERFRKGAINFSSQEVRFKLDETGKPVGIVVKESKEAHQLIEEFMLLANRTVAAHVSKVEVKGKELPFPYRVHDVPDESKLEVFAAFASRFGYKFNLSSPESIQHSFNDMLRLVQGKPEQHVLESLGIRTMAKAVYTTENIGHYGLGFEDYCHFTSPIRRYPDVLVHRILQSVLAGEPEVVKNLEQQCRHCSEQERAAMTAERAGNKYKQVEYMQEFVGEEFDAVISGVAAFGFWAETVDTKCEGMVSMADLSEIDEFVLLEGEYTLRGLHTGLKFQIGDTVRIRVVAASLETRQLDYMLAAMDEGAHNRARQKKEKAKENRGERRKKEKNGDMRSARRKK